MLQFMNLSSENLRMISTAAGGQVAKDMRRLCSEECGFNSGEPKMQNYLRERGIVKSETIVPELEMVA